MWGFTAFLFVGFVFVFLLILKKSQNNTSQRKTSQANLFVLLAVAVIKADGRIYKQEREFVRKKFQHDFGTELAEKYLANLEICLKKSVNVDALCYNINYNFELEEKLQILDFIVGIAVSNGILVRSEEELLKKIARKISVPYRTLRSLLSMHNYTFKDAHEQTKQKTQNEQRQTDSKTAPRNSLARAYSVLEIQSSATNEEVKKAYRRLAKLHHPDRVLNLGPEFQLSAKEKFQKLQEAYDLIKNYRGFK